MTFLFVIYFIMKKIDAKKLYSVLLKASVAIFACLLVAFVPTTIMLTKSAIAEKYKKASSYEGVLELWNIDTFEGGTASKKSFLVSCAIEYQKQNSRTLVMVKNLSPDECLLALSQGQRPAMFSFGHSFGNQIKDFLCCLDANNQIDKTIVDSGYANGELLALGYARSAYVLISEESRLSSKQETLSSQAFVCGKTKQLKNGKKRITYSLTCGLKSINSQRAFEEQFYPFVAGETTIDYQKEKTAYDAYCEFVDGKANILLGTIRDLVRVKNRENLGKLEGVVFEAFGGYTDLVQYVGVCADASSAQKQASKLFAKYLLANESQQKLKNIGLLSANSNNKLYESGVLADIENAAKNYYVSSVFE